MKSCSVPHWMRVLSNWPPMPIQVAEKESLVVAATEGTTQEALTLVTVGCGFCKSEDTT